MPEPKSGPRSQLVAKPSRPAATAREIRGRDDLRAHIITRARAIVDGEGLAAVQARRLAVEGGCSVGTLYNIFGDRDGVILAINRQTLTEMGEVLQAAREATRKEPLEARLIALARTYTAFALENLNRWLAVFEFRRPDNTPLPADYEALRARLLGLLEETIAEDVPDADERRTAARALFGAAHGILHLAVNNRLSDFDSDALEQDLRFIVKAAAAGMSRRV